MTQFMIGDIVNVCNIPVYPGTYVVTALRNDYEAGCVAVTIQNRDTPNVYCVSESHLDLIHRYHPDAAQPEHHVRQYMFGPKPVIPQPRPDSVLDRLSSLEENFAESGRVTDKKLEELWQFVHKLQNAIDGLDRTLGNVQSKMIRNYDKLNTDIVNLSHRVESLRPTGTVEQIDDIFEAISEWSERLSIEVSARKSSIERVEQFWSTITNNDIRLGILEKSLHDLRDAITSVSESDITVDTNTNLIRCLQKT